MTDPILAELADTLHSTGYDHITWWDREFEGWRASLSHEPDKCLCGHKAGCFCCDPINITDDVARYLAQVHGDLFTVTGEDPDPYVSDDDDG